jgi:DnaJ domain
MPTAARADLSAMMDAYKLLGLDYSADSAAIRHAHKRLAKRHHPDRFPVGSAEQQQATARMAAINDAYGLIREAPLRHHPVSNPPEPPIPSTDTELDDAIRRTNQRRGGWMTVESVDNWMTAVLVSLVVAVLVLMGDANVFKTQLAVHIPRTTPRQSGALIGSSTQASTKKMSAQELESQLIESSGYFADVKLGCEPKATEWDYICSYTPTDPTVFLRMHFGVNVDSKRILQISPSVPFGVPIPPVGGL